MFTTLSFEYIAWFVELGHWDSHLYNFLYGVYHHPQILAIKIHRKPCNNYRHWLPRKTTKSPIPSGPQRPIWPPVDPWTRGPHASGASAKALILRRLEIRVTPAAALASNVASGGSPLDPLQGSDLLGDLCSDFFPSDFLGYCK